jgi:hypothetical protein
VIIFFSSIAEAQNAIEKKEILIRTFENQIIKANLSLDYINDKLIVTANQFKSFCLYGFKDLDSLNVLDDKFIFIKYRVRGGSGVKLRKTLILCASKGAFRISMHVLSLNEYTFDATYDPVEDSLQPPYERGIYEVNILKLEKESSRYFLSVKEYEKKISKKDTAGNHEILDTLRLGFDAKSKVFYSEYKTLKGPYSLDGKSKVFKGEQYPVIKLLSNEYYFINNYWYDRVRGNCLVEAFSPCK